MLTEVSTRLCVAAIISAKTGALKEDTNLQQIVSSSCTFQTACPRALSMLHHITHHHIMLLQTLAACLAFAQC